MVRHLLVLHLGIVVVDVNLVCSVKVSTDQLGAAKEIGLQEISFTTSYRCYLR